MINSDLLERISQAEWEYRCLYYAQHLLEGPTEPPVLPWDKLSEKQQDEIRDYIKPLLELYEDRRKPNFNFGIFILGVIVGFMLIPLFGLLLGSFR